MQEVSEVNEAWSLEDDMLDGDLGDGMGVSETPSSTRKRSQRFAGLSESLLLRAEPVMRSSEAGEAAWIPALKTAERARWKLPLFAGSLDDLSKEELRERLQEATEVIDVLCCDLDVTNRYLEGKFEALKILQGKAMLDKATSHTKSMLQKSEDKAKALEKEVNSLQWELSFHQLQMTKLKQSWEQKYNRLLSENKILTDNIEEMDTKIQWLQAENSALSRKYLEVFSMLNVKEQRVYQETQPQYSRDRDTSVLEMAVLGACRCHGVTEACPCSRIAAASRKQLVELQQELDAQRSRREEALMVADAFRIAFEQQLRKRSEQFLLLTEAKILKSHHFKDEGLNRSPLVSVSQRLRGLLPSSLGKKMPEDLLETLYKLLDLLNDREEALAHQRKVSIMLAHSAEELQRQLHLDPHCQLPDQSESRIKSEQIVDTSVNHSQTQQTPDASESKITEVLPKIQAQPEYELSDSQLQLVQPSQHQNSSKPEIQQSDQSLS